MACSFARSDPDALNAWYREHLGVGAGCGADVTETASEWYWQAQGGPTVFAPFKADTDYLAADKQWMLNLRVSEIDALIDRAARGGDRGDHQAGMGRPADRPFRAHP